MKNSLGISKILLGLVLALSISACGSDDDSSTSASTNGETTTTTTTTTAPTNGLIAFFPFNGNTDDESGTGNNGTLNGATPTNDKDGNANSAFLFNGTSDFISAPVNINPSVLAQVTITAWVRADNITDPRMKVISHDNGSFDRTIGVDNRGGGAGWSAFSGTGGVLGFEPVVLGEWVFIAVVYDEDAGTVKLFVNNSKFEEQGTHNPGHNFIHIGANPSFGEFFNGAIDEVRIYNRALADSEIQLIFNQ